MKRTGMGKTYRHIFFDLDRTLWDFDKNTLETLNELFLEVRLPERGIMDFDHFLATYHQVNASLWEYYREGRLPQEVLRPMRFDKTFQYYGLFDPALAAWFGEEYLRRSAAGNDLFPGVMDLITHLHGRYILHIISNGFADVQYAKLQQSGLQPYLATVVTSEEAGSHKPEPAIFHFALEGAGARLDESLMIGDDLKMDIEGAAMAGIDQVWYNPGHLPSSFQPTYMISSLEELREIL